MAEGYALLGAVKEAQLKYYHMHEHFYECTGMAFTYNSTLGIDARPNKYFTTVVMNPGADEEDESHCTMGFVLWTPMPKDLREGFTPSRPDRPDSGGMHSEGALCLSYNITTGATFHTSALDSSI